MRITFDPTGSISGLKEAIATTLTDASVKGLLLLACDENHFSPSDTDSILKQIHLPVIGGIFPEIIYNNKHYHLGTLIVGLPERPDVHVIPSLSEKDADFQQMLDTSIQDLSHTQTMIVFVDGLSSRIEDFVNSLFLSFGLEINYLGGGAGSMSFEQKPCLFSNQGLLMDHAVVGLLPQVSGIGVKHGWQSIGGPYSVTESEGNVIKSLDWEPAFEVYKRVVEQVSQHVFEEGNFFDIAKSYPFGINKLGEEKVVRDPIILQADGAMKCIGDISDNCFVDILQGDVASLVHAAQSARMQGIEAFPNPEASQTHFLIDCISRSLFMGDEFEQELNAVYDGHTPLIGVLTLGEIANTGKDYLEFYNKTAVVGIFEG